MSYPFSMHDPASHVTPGYDLIQVDSKTSKIYICSILCTGVSSNMSLPCLPCQTSQSLITGIETGIKESSKKLHYAAMSNMQLRYKLVEV